MIIATNMKFRGRHAHEIDGILVALESRTERPAHKIIIVAYLVLVPSHPVGLDYGRV